MNNIMKNDETMFFRKKEFRVRPLNLYTYSLGKIVDRAYEISSLFKDGVYRFSDKIYAKSRTEAYKKYYKQNKELIEFKL